MATRRRGMWGKAGRGQSTQRKSSRSSGGQGHGHATGARRTRAEEAARELRSPGSRGFESAAGFRAGTDPSLRIARSPAAGEGAGEADAALEREAAEAARRIESALGGASETFRSGPASAADHLRAHREQVEEVARRRARGRELPGVGAIAMAFAVGALRLVRSVAWLPVRLAVLPFRIAVAPLRIGLALLRRRQREAAG